MIFNRILHVLLISISFNTMTKNSEDLYFSRYNFVVFFCFMFRCLVLAASMSNRYLKMMTRYWYRYRYRYRYSLLTHSQPLVNCSYHSYTQLKCSPSTETLLKRSHTHDWNTHTWTNWNALTHYRHFFFAPSSTKLKQSHTRYRFFFFFSFMQPSEKLSHTTEAFGWQKFAPTH